MVVVTGYTASSNTDSSQLVNMNPTVNDCSLLAPYKYSTHGAAGGLLNHQLVTCGGYSFGYKQDCYLYDTNAQDWTKFATLQTGRTDPAATTMSDGSLWITGKPYQVMTSMLFLKICLFWQKKAYLPVFNQFTI